MGSLSYNQFMELYEEFKVNKVNAVINRYKNQSEAARELGVDKATISRYLAGKQNLTDGTISEIIGMDIREVPVLTKQELDLEELYRKQNFLKDTMKELDAQIRMLENTVYKI